MKSDYKELRTFIHDICGIKLGEEKAYLLKQRLEPVARSFGCDTLEDLTSLLKDKGNDTVLKEKIITEITTNETSFFRDPHFYQDFQRHILPKVFQIAKERASRVPVRRGNKIAIWSAASSTGQEAYSLAMLINEYLGDSKEGIVPYDFSITGTDISSKVLTKAIAGCYKEFETERGLTVDRRNKHFERDECGWNVKPHLRNMVQFRQLNLMEDFSFLGSFDIVFIRNVLIYFDDLSKKRILEKIHSMLAPEGLLVLGAAESLYNITDKFESLKYGQSIFYKKC